MNDEARSRPFAHGVWARVGRIWRAKGKKGGGSGGGCWRMQPWTGDAKGKKGTESSSGLLGRGSGGFGGRRSGPRVCGYRVAVVLRDEMEARQGSGAPAVMPRLNMYLCRWVSCTASCFTVSDEQLGYLRCRCVSASAALDKLGSLWGGGSQLQTPYSYRWEAACANERVRCLRFGLFTL